MTSMGRFEGREGFIGNSRGHLSNQWGEKTIAKRPEERLLARLDKRKECASYVKSYVTMNRPP